MKKISLKKIKQGLFEPVDASSMVFFRIYFACIAIWEVYRYFDHNWISRYWVDPPLNFKYYGFSWVKAWPGDGMEMHFIFMGIVAVFILFGLLYRVSTALFFLAFTYMFLLEQARYLNHFYLFSILSFMLILVPAHSRFSLDGRLGITTRRKQIPAWSLWFFRIELIIVYFYAGLAKLNPDWIRGKPMDEWLAKKHTLPVIESFLSSDFAPYLFSHGGLAFDLFIGPLLLWRRTRLPAFIAATAFHLTNAWMFNIGIFPWFMIGATTLFFRPDWPVLLLEKVKIIFSKFGKGNSKPSFEYDVAGTRMQKTIIMGLVIFFTFQLLFPLRHILYSGVVHWTEEGHRFAWHMKLRDKDADAVFYVQDLIVGDTTEVEPREYLKRWQARKMAGRPDMILQFAKFLGEDYGGEDIDSFVVTATVYASLNGREPQLLIKPNINLLEIERNLAPADWILPLVDY